MKCSICKKAIKGIIYWINSKPVCGECFQRFLLQKRRYDEESYKSNNISNPLDAYHKEEDDLLTELYGENEEFEE